LSAHEGRERKGEEGREKERKGSGAEEFAMSNELPLLATSHAISKSSGLWTFRVGFMATFLNQSGGGGREEEGE